MTLNVQDYLINSNIAEVEIKYKWDDWDVESAYEPLDDGFVDAMSTISHRANIAFTTASAEWIAYRFSEVSRDPVPAEYAEAAWAAVIDWRYAEYFEPPDSEWMGTVRGPLSLSIILMVDAINRADQDDTPSIASAAISNLAIHVCGDPSAYIAWQSKVVDRMTHLFPFEPGNPMGAALPREALDPEFDFKLADAPALIAKFLSGLDHSRNRFLVAPAQMTAMGFQGTPYEY